MRYLKSLRCNVLILSAPFFVGLISNDAFRCFGLDCAVLRDLPVAHWCIPSGDVLPLFSDLPAVRCINGDNVA